MNQDTSPEVRYNHLPMEIRRELREAAREHCITARSMLGPGMFGNVVAGRVRVMKFLRNRGYSYPQIGRIFGMHHTSVWHHLNDRKKPKPVKEPVFPDYSGEWAI